MRRGWAPPARARPSRTLIESNPSSSAKNSRCPSGCLLFLFLGMIGIRIISIAICRWHIAAISSETDGYIYFCPLGLKCKRIPHPLPKKNELLSTKSSFFFYPSRRLGISSRRSRVYHQPLWGCISSRISVHPPAAWWDATLRVDDMQFLRNWWYTRLRLDCY